MSQELLIINTETIAEVKELMGAKMPLMFDYFLTDSRSYVEKIESGFNFSDIDMIIVASHTLKSSSRLIGAEQLSKKAEEIEKFSRIIAEEKEGLQKLGELKSNIVEIRYILEQTMLEYLSYRQSHNI